MRLFQRPAAVLLLAFTALLGSPPPGNAQPAPQQPPAVAADATPRVQRLAHLARLWGSVKYFHPYLAYREIDWDQALLEAIPRVRAAETPQAYAAAVQSMLDKLGDPVTAVRPLPPEPSPAPSVATPAATSGTTRPAEPLFRWEEGEVLVLDLRRVAARSGGLPGLYEQIPALTQEIAKAQAVVLDVRSLPQEDNPTDLRYALETLNRALVSRTVRAPSQRYLMHSGYTPQQGGTSGGYYSAFLTRMAETYSPLKEGTPRKRVVLLINRGSQLPLSTLALQAAGDATILSEGEIGDETVALRRTHDIGEGFQAVVRLGEIQPMPGWPGVHADIVVPAPPAGSAEDVALRMALAEARKAPAAPPASVVAEGAAGAGQPLPDAVWRPDPVYGDLKDPSLEHRLLAVFRIWNVIHYFYPYQPLIGDWDAVLPQFIGKMEAVSGARDYALTVAEMMTHVPDGHTSVSGSELLRIYGESFLPVSLRWIEGSYVVTNVWGGAKDARVEAGDVLVAVDGQPAEARAEFFRRTLTASTEAALRNRIGAALLRGPEGSTATLTLRGRGEVTREVKATRVPFSPPPPDGETVRILPGGIGLVDLRQLERAEVDAMFDKVKDTRALIFDLRGYPRGTAWSIAPRLNVRGATVGATFRRPQIDGFSSQRTATEFGFSQPLPVSDQPKYTRPTVMLIDDRAISQAEHTGLFFEAAAGTVFIGTPTAGANGDVTNFYIPGGMRIGFTGHDVRHADGRQLQRVGLQPHVEVVPTLEGIRAGRDEVLERAIRYLEEHAPAP